MLEKTQTEQAELKAKVSEGRKRLSDEVQLANDAKQWVEAIQEYANITELDAATLNRLIKEIVVHERIDEDKTRHISIEIHFNLKPIPQEYANITELDAATLNRLIKEIVVHERIDEDKTRHISIEIHFNLKPIPEVEQVTA